MSHNSILEPVAGSDAAAACVTFMYVSCIYSMSALSSLEKQKTQVKELKPNLT